jgi:hypothetical protein
MLSGISQALVAFKMYTSGRLTYQIYQTGQEGLLETYCHSQTAEKDGKKGGELIINEVRRG